MQELVNQLCQYRALKTEIKRLEQRIAELETEAQGSAIRITGMPKSGQCDDRVARAAVCIAELKNRMEARRLQCVEELNRLYAFIDGADDSLTRQILAARYIDGMSWKRVAASVGWYDEQVPRRLHNRYLRKKVANGIRSI